MGRSLRFMPFGYVIIVTRQEAVKSIGEPSAGRGFPVAKWLALFDLATGLLLRATISPLKTHDLSRACEVESEVAAGDVVPGDRKF